MKQGFLSLAGRGVKQKKVGNNNGKVVNMDNHDVVVEEDTNAKVINVHHVSFNEEDAGSFATKYHDMERKMLEGKVVLVRDG